MIATLRTHYAAPERVSVDWSKLALTIRARYPRLNTDAQLWLGLKHIYTTLDEPHSEVTNGEETVEGGRPATIVRLGDKTAATAWMREYRDGILNDVLAGRGHHVGNQKIFWGRRGNIGFISFMTMGGYTTDNSDDGAALDAILDDALTAFSDARAVIIDVSNNRGGHDSIAGAIASRFAERSHLAYTKVPAATPEATPQPFFIHPSPRVRYIGPVYVLTSDITVSAAEVFALSMKGLPNVTTVGTTTRGALSDMLAKPLDNGWIFTLPAEIYSDDQGRRFEGLGVEPDQAFDIYGQSGSGHNHAASVLRLMDELSK